MGQDGLAARNLIPLKLRGIRDAVAAVLFGYAVNVVGVKVAPIATVGRTGAIKIGRSPLSQAVTTAQTTLRRRMVAAVDLTSPLASRTAEWRTREWVAVLGVALGMGAT